MHQKKTLSDSGSDSSSDSNSSSGSGSDSDSGSGSSSSGNSVSSGKSRTSVNNSTIENKESNQNESEAEEKNDDDEWYDNSDEVGIRRSGRSCKEPERLKVPERNSRNRSNSSNRNSSSNNWNSSDNASDSENEVPPPSRRPGVKKTVTRRLPQKSQQNNRKRAQYLSESSECSEGSDDENSRTISRRQTTASVSYKEASDEGTDSEDLLEVAEPEIEVPVETEEKCETIERVLDQRRGKKGVTGNQTTLYAVEDNGDPNADVEISDLENTEMQYLIKWKDWAHIHNTWESEESLKNQKVKGIKKLENFIKKDLDIQFWRKHTAGPEDIDYYECQLELVQDLLKSYYNVERIIAKLIYELSFPKKPE